jgi:hypothetical protein
MFQASLLPAVMLDGIMKCNRSLSHYLINRAFQIIQFLLNLEFLLEFVKRLQYW